ncbi:Ig-like domain-containing protein [Alcanivorax sp.]|uniref:Ig-like domain-containing protein n=1 Tax=Alcanivorax sp. TaxID=1872427 RepID=UPI0025B7CCD3|nr:Ig-like domain-containing protein [Alcanivorax sp.]
MRHIALWQTLAGCALIFAAASSQATVYKIETTDDVAVTVNPRPENASPEENHYAVTSATSGAQCRLREAIYAISYQTTVGACEAGTGNDVIRLLEGKTYLLTEGELPLGGRKIRFVEKTIVNGEGEEEVVLDDGDNPVMIPVADPEDDTAIAPNIKMNVFLAAFEEPEDKEKPVISAGSSSRLFSLQRGSLTLGNLILQEGSAHNEGDVADRNGGLILARGDVGLSENVTLRQGEAVNGGAVYLQEGSSFSFPESTLFEDNRADGNGAVLATSPEFDGSISGHRFSITGNESQPDGGLFYLDGAEDKQIGFSLTNGTIFNNSGGVIQLVAPKHQLVLQNMTIAFNDGLALHLDEAVVDAPTDPEAASPEIFSTAFILNTVLVGNSGGACSGTALDGAEDADATLLYTITDDAACPLPREQTEGTPVTLTPNGATAEVLLGWNETTASREACDGTGVDACKPIPAEELGGDFSGFLPNPEPEGLDPAMPAATPSLFDRGNPETVDQCADEDMRGQSRGGAGGRCDVGAVEFLRALAQPDEIDLISGQTVLGDVLANDKNDTQVDCGRLEPIIVDEGTCAANDDVCLEQEVVERCMTIIVAPERGLASVEVDDQGYPRVRYTPATRFHGVDQLRYVVAKEAFAGGTDIGLDQSEIANMVAEPASGLTEPKSILGGSSGGSTSVLALLILAGGGLLRRWRLGIAALAMMASGTVLSADIEVTSLLDHNPSITNDGLCTLREALANAATFSSPDCEFGTKGEDRILLPAGDIQLVDTLVIQGGAVELVGKGVRNADDAEPDEEDTVTRILGDGQNRLFEVRAPVSNGHPSVAFRYLILEGGNAAVPGGTPIGDQGFGGAVITGGSVVFDRVILRNNHADRSGGVIYVRANAGNEKQVSFNRAYVVGNEAVESGGVMSTTAQNGENVRFAAVDTTFENNSANVEGGVFDFNIPTGNFVAFSNSTFVDNTAPKGSALDLSGVGIDVRLMNLSLVNNAPGNGIELGDSDAEITLANSIVAASGASCSTGTAVLLDSIYNLFSDAACVASGTDENNDDMAGGTAGMSAETKGEAGSSTDYTPPYLPAQDLTDPLIVDAGNDDEELQSGTAAPLRCRATDLRGIARTSGGRCDRGAFEYQQITAIDDEGNNERAPDRRVLVDIFDNDLPSDGAEIQLLNENGELIDSRFVFTPAQLDIVGEEEEINPATGSYIYDSASRSYVLEGSGTQADGTSIEFVWEFYSESVDGYDVKCGEPLPQRFIDRNPDNYDDGDVAENCVVLFTPSNKGFIPDADDSTKDAVCEALNDDEKETPRLFFLYHFEDSADPAQQSLDASVTMTITNKAPKITGQTRASRPGEAVTFKIVAEDPDGDESSINWPTLTIKNEPSFAKRNSETGAVQGEGIIIDSDARTVTYIPDSNFSPFKDRFTLEVEDKCGSTSLAAMFTITYPGEQEDNSAGSWGFGLFSGLSLLLWRRRRLAAA